MALDQASKDKLLGFIGYGSEHPRIIFIGGEEALDGDAMVNLQARCAHFQFPRHDKNIAMPQLATAHKAAGDFKSAAVCTCALIPGSVPVWTFSAMMTAALRTPDQCAPGGPWLTQWELEYSTLGTREGDTLLTELYPLPKPGLDKWPPVYTREFGYAGFKDYYARLWPKKGNSRRRQTLAEIVSGVATHTPRYVVEYCRGGGNEFWERFSGILHVVESTGPTPRGDARLWHVIEKNRIEVALTMAGTRVARTGFPWGQHKASQVTDAHVHVVANALKSLRPT